MFVWLHKCNPTQTVWTAVTYLKEKSWGRGRGVILIGIYVTFGILIQASKRAKKMSGSIQGFLSLPSSLPSPLLNPCSRPMFCQAKKKNSSSSSVPFLLVLFPSNEEGVEKWLIIWLWISLHILPCQSHYVSSFQNC